MKRLIIRYKDYILKVTVDKVNTCILDSYKVKSISDMRGVLKEIRNEVWAVDDINRYPQAIHYRTLFSMVNEWRVHNLLYSLGILRDRVGSVDLNTNQPWYIKLLYTVLSPFYFHFY